MTKYLAMAIHGASGVGKSWLADSAPGPRLILDAEGGSDWTASPKIYWDPSSSSLPTEHADGSPITTDTSVVVNVISYETMKQVYAWLASGQHYFESVIMDSLTEIQKRAKDSIRGGSDDAMTERLWGILLDKMERLVRDYRDLRKNPIKGCNVFITALTLDRNNRQTPDVQGALARQLTSYMDVTGMLFVQQTEVGLQRMLAIQPVTIPPSMSVVDAKDRTHQLTQMFGAIIAEPNLTAISQSLNTVGAVA